MYPSFQNKRINEEFTKSFMKIFYENIATQCMTALYQSLVNLILWNRNHILLGSPILLIKVLSVFFSLFLIPDHWTTKCK